MEMGGTPSLIAVWPIAATYTVGATESIAAERGYPHPFPVLRQLWWLASGQRRLTGVQVRRWVHDDGMDGAAAVRELWSRLYKTLETGDASAWSEALAEDALVIGTDEAEWWQGKAAAMRVIKQQVTELHEAGVRYAGSDPQVNEVADVYWVADRPNVVLADGTTVRARFTAVATRVEDALLLRQVHVSIGSPNDEVLQQQLTV